MKCGSRNGEHILVRVKNDIYDAHHLASLIERTYDDSFHSENKHQGKTLYSVIITNKALPFGKEKSYPTTTKIEPFISWPGEFPISRWINRFKGQMPTQLVLVCLEDFKKTAGELSTPLDRWVYLLKDPSLRSEITTIPQTRKIESPELIAGSDPAVNDFINQLRI